MWGVAVAFTYLKLCWFGVSIWWYLKQATYVSVVVNSRNVEQGFLALAVLIFWAELSLCCDWLSCALKDA